MRGRLNFVKIARSSGTEEGPLYQPLKARCHRWLLTCNLEDAPAGLSRSVVPRQRVESFGARSANRRFTGRAVGLTLPRNSCREA